jgi:ABC-type glutathione transport system ATPase component
VSPEPPLLTVTDLDVDAVGGARLVSRVSFELRRGELLGFVGESGSGKSLTCRAVLGALPAGCVVASGAIEFAGLPLQELDTAAARRARYSIGAVFQDPASYLNPSLSVGRQLTEVLRVRRGLERRAARQRALELFELVGLANRERVFGQIPSELSGGMQQRVMLAIAVSCDPALLVADEPTTALDVKTQSEVLALLASLRERLGLSVLFVSHDLDLVLELCDRVAVFHDGEIVERGAPSAILTAPSDPYTRFLLASAGLHELEAAGA